MIYSKAKRRSILISFNFNSYYNKLENVLSFQLGTSILNSTNFSFI